MPFIGTEGDIAVKIVEITKEPVELYKILKFEGIVSSGGEAKAVIDDGQVLVNGEIEKRKRKKIMSGDVIKFMNNEFKVKLTGQTIRT
ncbi:MAG TPA: RNA-binding S4 domain-containing protein [Kangiella sp.]